MNAVRVILIAAAYLSRNASNGCHNKRARTRPLNDMPD
jgi:hypothetical protein